MRAVPAIRQRQPAPTLGDLVALLGVSFDAWRLRRINAGLQRAHARGDTAAVVRWVSRGEKALADMEIGRRALARKRASPHSS